MTPRLSKRTNSASALLAVYWTLAVLGLIVFSVSQFVLDDLEAVGNRQDYFEARLLAERGITFASHPQIKRDDPLLRQNFKRGRFVGDFIGEGARINLNAVLLREQDDILENLFSNWGLEPDQIDLVVGALMDWVDSDDLTRFTGAEEREYEESGIRGYPFNRPFRNLDEARLVRGMDWVDELRPDWRESFTLWSDGKVDVSAAEADIISAATSSDPVAAESLVVSRRGPDGIDGTEDDVRLNSLDAVLQMLQVPTELSESMEQRITIQDDTSRVTGIGTINGVSVRQTLVIRQRSSRPTLLHFSEVLLDEEEPAEEDVNPFFGGSF